MKTDCANTYGLIGYPLGHSFSERFFNEKFRREGIDAQYLNFEIPSIEDFPKILADNPQLSGLNVTIPYKQQIMPYLTSIDAEAEQIGAVNVIKIARDSQGQVRGLKGYNTDVTGFVESIRPMLRPEHRQALVLGTGGASKAVCYGLRSLGIEPTLVSRHGGDGRLEYSQLGAEAMAQHLVIVNATPVGMHPHIDECPPISYQLITPQHVCYDLIYNPAETMFLQRARQQGAAVKNGSEMLLLQALAAWKIWRDNT